MDSNRPLIWFKGIFTSVEQAQVSILSPSAQFGLNVFEGIRGYSNSYGQVFLFRVHDHLNRLMDSCRLIDIESPYSVDEILDAIIKTIQINHMHSDRAVRVTLFVDGLGSWSSSAPVEMSVAPIFKPRNELVQRSGLFAVTSTWRRIEDTILPPRAKVGANYINGRYAQLEAQAVGAQFPIMLNHSGKVAESAGACIFMIRDRVLITPSRTASILESITRNTLVTLASEFFLITQERDIDRTELYLADEVFLCGSAAEVTPLTRIDRFTIGDGSVGKFTRLLSDKYFCCADGTECYDHISWITPVWN